MSPTKMAEPVEMPIGLLSWVGPRNHVLRWALIPQGKEQFGGMSYPIIIN